MNISFLFFILLCPLFQPHLSFKFLIFLILYYSTQFVIHTFKCVILNIHSNFILLLSLFPIINIFPLYHHLSHIFLTFASVSSKMVTYPSIFYLYLTLSSITKPSVSPIPFFLFPYSVHCVIFIIHTSFIFSLSYLCTSLSNMLAIHFAEYFIFYYFLV